MLGEEPVDRLIRRAVLLEDPGDPGAQPIDLQLLLPALAATFMLVFARVGAMVMLLPGFGESNIPVRIKLAIALLLTALEESMSSARMEPLT